VWVLLAVLVGESLVPGVAILIVLASFPILARSSHLVDASAAVLALSLAVAAATRWHGAAPSIPLVVLTALATAGVLRVIAGGQWRASLSPPPPRTGLVWVSTAVGLAAVAVLPLAPVLDRLRDDVAAAPQPTARTVLVPAGVLLVVAAPPVRRRP